MSRYLKYTKLTILGMIISVLGGLGSELWAASSTQEFPVVRAFGIEQSNDHFKLMGGCMHRRMSFRLMQVIADRQCSDKILRPYDLSLKSEWMFGCALNFFQKERYIPGTDQGLWLPHRFSMNAGDKAMFKFSGRSRSTGERFIVAPASTDLSETYFDVSNEWGEKVQKDYMTVRDAVFAELKKDPKFKDFPDVSPETRKEFIELFNKRMAEKLPKVLTPEQLALDKKLDDLAARLNRILNSPQEDDYTYMVLNPGVKLPAIISTQKLPLLEAPTLSLETACTETREGKPHISLCRIMGYRAAQLASKLWEDEKFHQNDVQVETGWKSHGLQDFFTEVLKVPSDRVFFGIHGQTSDPQNYSLADGWFRFTVLSTGEELLLRATEDLLPSSLLELRTLVKSGKADEKTKNNFVIAMKRQIERATALPFYGGFEVRLEHRDRGVRDNELSYVNGSGKAKSISIRDLELMETLDTDSLFAKAMGFRVAQIVSKTWDDGLFHGDKTTITVNKASLQSFWLKTLQMPTSSVQLNDEIDGPMTISVTTDNGSFHFQETDDLGRRDYSDMKAYADTLHEDSEGEGNETSVFSKGHDHLSGWDLAHHITEESMKAIRLRLTTAPFVGYLKTSRSTPGSSGGCTVGFTSAALILAMPLILLIKH